MQIEKAQANQENILIILTADGTNAHNTTKYILFAARFFFGCVVSICKRVRGQIDKRFFLICRCFFLFAAHLFFWLCCEHLQRVRCQIEEVVSLICMCFLKLLRVELSRPPYIHHYPIMFVFDRCGSV